ncbi:MAG: hypothetical protein H6557_11005 [Lewinellaceae bacterium]|nr:hypothetical protein [Lewinellaceae bacterium]
MNALARLIAIFLFAGVPWLGAQNQYPVDVSGIAVPPYSLNLEEYATIRPDGLVFFLTLNDPVEPFRDVVLRLTIFSDGEEIMFTDPNFQQLPIRLNQFQTEIFDGARLAPWLQGKFLAGSRGGRGGSILPQGANRICLEVIDVQRNVPISDRYCLSGNFRLSLPPQLRLPANRSDIPQSQASSLLFNWTPKHLISGNPPGPVAYTFTLVEVLPGIANPNDAFEQAFPIFETTQPAPTFLYAEGLPPLEAGKWYAWRVQASQSMGYALFENDGWSEVFSFRIYDDAGGAATDPTSNGILRSGAGRNCAPFSVDFGPVPHGGQQSAPMAEGETIKVGFFEMEVTQINSQANGYSGKGFVIVPFLKSKIKARFRNVKVNEWKRAYEIGSVIAEKDNPELDFDPDLLSGGNIPKVFSQAFLESLTGYLESRRSQGRFVSRLSESVSALTGLPLVLDKKRPDGQAVPPVIVLDLRLGVREARMTALSFLPGSPEGEWITFLAPRIGITPFGIQQGIGLNLIEDAFIPAQDNMGLLAHGESSPAAPSSLECDCEGYTTWNPVFSLAFQPEFMMHADSGGQVALPLTEASGQLPGLMGSVSNLPPVAVAGLPGFRFQAGAGAVDCSPSDLLPQADQLPAAPEEFKTEAWQGVYFRNPRASLPPEYDISGAGQAMALSGEALYIDGSGLTGRFSGDHLATLQEGRLGSWPCSIDQLQLDIRNSRIFDSRIQGMIKVPALADAFHFEARLHLSGQDDEAEIRASPRSLTTSLPMWQASINLSDSSQVRAPLRRFDGGRRQFLPGASLYGVISLDLPDEQMEGLLPGGQTEIKRELEKILGTSGLGLRLENLKLQGLQINPSAEPEKRFRLDGYDASGATLAIGGKPFPLHSVQLKYRPGENQDGTAEEIGLVLTVKKQSRFVHLILWGGRQSEGSYGLQRIAVETGKAACDCVGPKEAAANLSNFSLEREGRQLFLRLPFLDNLQLEMTRNTGAHLKALWKEGHAGKNLEAADIQKLLADAQPDNSRRRLPYDLTPHLPAILGVESYHLPAGARLILASLEVDRESASAGLLLYCEKEGLPLAFIAEGVSIGPNSFGLSGLEMHLLEDVKSRRPTLPVTFRKGGLASFSCKGLESFRLPAVYEFDPSQLARAGEAGGQPLALEFVVQGKDPFDFVAPLEVDGGAASFAIPGGEGQVFHLKSGFADFSATDSPPGMPGSFTGLCFKELEMELEGFQGPGDSPLLIPCRDFFFVPGTGLGLNGEVRLQGLAGELAPLNWGGWLFAIDRFRYRVDNNTVVQREANGRLRLPQSPGLPWLRYRLSFGYEPETIEPAAHLALERQALRAYLAQEGISNYSVEMQLSENKVFLPVLMVDGSPATFDYCLRFDGSEAGIEMDGSGTVGSSYTKEAWVYLYPGSEAGSFLAGQYTRLGIVAQNGELYLSAGHNGNWAAVRDTTPLPPNTWHHVAVSYDASTQEMRLYRNGALAASRIAPLHSETQQFVGAPPGQLSFNGRISEIRIWNAPRSLEEIRAYRNQEADADDPALAVYYRLSEGPGSEELTDLTGNGHNARMANMNPEEAWSGMIAHNTTGITGLAPAKAFRGQNYALRFDGAGGRISLGRRISLAGLPFTIECRARREASGRDQYLAGQGFGSENQGLNIGFLADGHFVFGFHQNSLKAEVPQTDNDWHRWACVFDPEAPPGTPNRFIYRDGQLLASDSSPAAFQGQGAFFIGAGMGGCQPFNGFIGEFRIWQAARSPEEIRGGFTNPLSAFQPGLLAYYPMNEGAGSLIRDHSGHGHTGTLERLGAAGSWSAVSLPVPVSGREAQAALDKRLVELKESARRAKITVQDIWHNESQVPAAFQGEFREAAALAAHEAERAMKLVEQMLAPQGEQLATEEAISQAIEAAATAEALAQDALSLAREVAFYPDQGADYTAVWDEKGKITVRYRNYETYRRVKHLLATDDPSSSFHWDTWSKSHYLMKYNRRGSGWELKKSVRGFPFPGQAGLRGNVVRLDCYDQQGKTVIYEASRPKSDRPIVLKMISASPAVRKSETKGEGKIRLLAEKERYEKQQTSRLRLEYEDGSPANSSGLMVINWRQEKVIEGKIKGRRRPRFIYTRLHPNGSREEMKTGEVAFELEAGQPYLALLKNKKGKTAIAGLDSAFWNSTSAVEFSGFLKQEEANRLVKQELQSRFEARSRREREQAPPPVPLLKLIRAGENGLSLSWEATAEGGDPLQLELYRRMHDAGANWELIHTTEASGEKTFADAGAESGRRYEYAAQSARPNGLVSGLSLAVAGQLPFEEEQYQLDNLSARKVADSGIQLGWAPPRATGGYDLQVYRSSGAEAVQPFARLTGEAEQFVDSSPAPGAVYNYAVQAILKDGRKGKRSAVVSVWYE